MNKSFTGNTMNIIEKAITDLSFNIPREILERTFVSVDLFGRLIPVSLETKIREKVIDARVLVDMNIIGGEQVTFALDDINPQWIDPPYSAVYKIPKTKTRGQRISSVLSVAYGAMNASGNIFSAQAASSPMLDAVGQVLQAAMPIPMVSTASVEMIGENTIFVKDTINIPTQLWCRCFIENDENLNNLSVRYAHDFSQLVELATKAYVFNSMNIKLDMGQLHAGLNLGKIREIIDGYADANEQYKQHLEETMRKVSIMNDGATHKRILGMLVGGGR